MALFLSSYYKDYDHPSGIVFIEFKNKKFDKYNLLKDLYQQLINSKTKKVSSYYYEIQQDNPNFDQQLLDEIMLACNENKVIAKDRGWKDFLNKKAMGWVIIELSEDKKEFFNDHFWSID